MRARRAAVRALLLALAAPGSDGWNAYVPGLRRRRDASHRSLTFEPHLDRDRAPLTLITNTTSLGDVPDGETSSVASGELSFFDQPGSTYECRLDPIDEFAPFEACASPVAYTDETNGTHVFEVRATTLPLNGQSAVEAPPAEYQWTIAAADTTAPDTTIQLGPADGTTSTSATFLFSGTDNLTAPTDLTFECSLDGAPFTGCDSGIVYPGLSVDTHTFKVRASDAAVPPNVDGEPVSHTWTIEAAGAPNTPAGTNVEVEVDGATLTFADVTAAGVTSVSTLSPADAPELPNGYFTDGALYYDVSTTATFLGQVTVCLPYTGLDEPHLLHYDGGWIDVTLELQGALVCGVVSSLSPFAIAETDIAPNTNIVQFPADPTIQSRADGADVQFQFTSTLPLSDFECSLDGAPFTGCSTPYMFNASFGPHTLLVRAMSETDVRDLSPASHTWTVLARPVATITQGPLDEAPETPDDIENESQTAAFTFSTDQPGVGSSFECRLTGEDTGTAWETCTSPKTYEDLGLGAYTFEVQAISAAGHASFLPAEFEWEVADLTAPVVTIDSGPSGTVDATTATFVFSANEPAIFECSLDGAAFGVCHSGTTYTGFGLGQHTFTVRAEELSEGGSLSEPVSRGWTVADLTAPTPTIGQKPPATTSDTTAEFTFSATDNWPGAVTFQCRLDGELFAACASPKPYSGLSAAEHTFEVRTTDVAGNEQSATHNWTIVDNGDPLAEITDVGAGSIVFEFTGTDDHTAPGDLDFECRLDSAAYSGCTSPKTYTTAELNAMTPGQHTFQVRAIDEVGNVGQPDSHTFTVADTIAPDTSITGHPVATTTNPNASFSFTGSDDLTVPASLTFECALDGAAFAACTAPKSYSGLAVGSHTFQVRASDTAGNTDSTPASYSWTIVDASAPETTITGHPVATTPSTGASFSFAGSDDTTTAASLTFQCSLDGAAFAACTTPKAYSGLAAGSHTFQVRASDAAGNVDASPASYAWTVLDSLAPETTITGHPVATTTNPNASFSFTGSDDFTVPASLTFECALDGAAFAACTTPKSYSGLAVGSHTFRVRATDAAGNVDASPASYTWEIQVEADTTAPETTITGEPPATTIETSASFGFSSSETPSTFECALDGAAFAACTSPRVHSALAVGSHTFRVRATDAAGNTDLTPASSSWTIESQVVDCGPQQTLNASADAWIDQGSPSSNKGSDSILKVMSKSNNNLRGLVRFNLPAQPQGCSVESATLRIYAASSTGGRTIHVLQLDGSWTEGGVTWQNQPATIGGAVTTSSGTGYRNWNVAGLVQAMYTGANNGFLVRDANENQDAEQQFHSREKGSDLPQLVLQFAPGAPLPGGAAPNTSITGNPLSATTSASATFTFTGVDDATPATSLTFQCQLDVAETSPWTDCTNPRVYSGLAEGSHTFRVRAVDAAGNVDASPAVYTWAIDQTAPESIISNGPGSSTNSTSASFPFTSPGPGVVFECSLDSAPYASCTSPKSYSNLTVGSHTFRVRAIDAAGNVDLTPASYPWTIQSGAPVNCGPAQTMPAVADSWIEQSSASSNKGSDSILKVMSKSGNSNLRALVRFNLPSIPAGCVLDTATLRVYAGSASSGQRTLQALRLNGSWTESGVTWSNAPATAGSAATTTSGTGYRQWSVAALVQAMYSSGSNNGFLIKDATEGRTPSSSSTHARRARTRRSWSSPSSPLRKG